jgi:uncharacterized protein YlaN (UPF0358 family)
MAELTAKQKQELRNKAYYQIVPSKNYEDKQSVIKNNKITLDNLDLNQGITGQEVLPQQKQDLQKQAINDTAQTLINNKKAAVMPKAVQATAQETVAPDSGIDWGAIGKGGLDLLGKGADALSKVKTSNLIGIAAGTEAGSKDPNTFLASSLGAKSGELSQMEAQAENDKIKLQNQGIDGQTITVVDDKTGKQTLKLIDKNTGAVIKDYGEPGYAGIDPRTVNIAGDKAYASAVGREQGQAVVAGQQAEAEAGSIAEEAAMDIDKALEANKNSYGGGVGELQFKAIQAAGGGANDEKFQNTSKVINTMQGMVAKVLKSTFGGQLSDGERKYLNEVYGALPGMTKEQREIAMNQVKNTLEQAKRRQSAKVKAAGGTSTTQPQDNKDPLGLGI